MGISDAGWRRGLADFMFLKLLFWLFFGSFLALFWLSYTLGISIRRRSCFACVCCCRWLFCVQGLWGSGWLVLRPALGRLPAATPLATTKLAATTDAGAPVECAVLARRVRQVKVYLLQPPPAAQCALAINSTRAVLVMTLSDLSTNPLTVSSAHPSKRTGHFRPS